MRRVCVSIMSSIMQGVCCAVLTLSFCGTALQEVAEHLGAPPVKEGQVEALNFAQEVAADPKLRFDVTLRPGGPHVAAMKGAKLCCARHMKTILGQIGLYSWPTWGLGSTCKLANVPDQALDAICHAGDVLLNHNLTTFHSRGTWEDGEEASEKRHMMRIWIASPHGW